MLGGMLSPLKVRSPAFRFSMLYTYPPYASAETLSPNESCCLLGRTGIRGCKVFSSKQQPGAWMEFCGSSLFQPLQLTNESIAVSLHVSKKLGSICISPPCNETKLSKTFLGFFFPPDYASVEWLPKYFTFIQLVRWIVLLVCFFSLVLQLAVFLTAWLLTSFTPDSQCCWFSQVLADVAN